MKKHEDFEADIKNMKWEFLSYTMFYIRDGNHQYVGWMKEIAASKYSFELLCDSRKVNFHLPTTNMVLSVVFISISQ